MKQNGLNLIKKIYHSLVSYDKRTQLRVWYYFKITLLPANLNRLKGTLSMMSLPAGLNDLKLSFVGPWASTSGLGVASRGYLSLFPQMNIAFNAMPVSLSAPDAKSDESVEAPIIGFAGKSDVCIVHLNAENWHLYLEPAHVNVFNDAKLCIGLWVWEAPPIPPYALLALSSLNALWVPSGYCKDIFAQFTRLPVYVVPHTVLLPDLAQESESRAIARLHLGLPSSAKIILYVFDGASVLERKNPFALINAFIDSGLAASGWQLVLKSKKIFAIPALGNRLVEQVQRCSSIKLIKEPIPEAMLQNLMLGCDMYVSPHCAEGFGLTVAEAMAAQKLVVATDFGGTRDFLDHETGYPVKYRMVELTESAGPYVKGSVWANIDEEDLKDQLCLAASDLAAGRFSRALNARQRIAKDLSAQAVTAAMELSLKQLLGQAPAHAAANPAG